MLRSRTTAGTPCFLPSEHKRCRSDAGMDRPITMAETCRCNSTAIAVSADNDGITAYPACARTALRRGVSHRSEDTDRMKDRMRSFVDSINGDCLLLKYFSEIS